MRTWERLTKLQKWLYEELCRGRALKCPVFSGDKTYAPKITDFTEQEPRVFLAWQPMRPSQGGQYNFDPISVVPSLTVMPNAGHARLVEEKRFDRFKNIHRVQQMGQTLSLSILFSVYEPGIRLPGFRESLALGKPDMTLFHDGTEDGLQTLVNWMDDAMELFIREKTVPDTDLILDDDTMIYSLYTDQEYVTDRRPYYYGFVNVSFKGYADAGNNKNQPSRAAMLLDGLDE